ncbi:MAG: TetR/AcrR family transcriptional regulator [Halobacteriales archaeon]
MGERRTGRSRDGDSEHAIREAAFRALVTHGYAECSIAAIGAEFAGSPSLIYHYFDSKDDLLLSTLEVFTETFIESIIDRPIDDPDRDLGALIEGLIEPRVSNEDQLAGSLSVDSATASARIYVELWAQAIWQDDYRERVTAVDERLVGAIAETLEAGVERGQYQPMDVDVTAEHLFSLVRSLQHVRATTDRVEAVDRLRSAIQQLLDDRRADAAPVG